MFFVCVSILSTTTNHSTNMTNLSALYTVTYNLVYNFTKKLKKEIQSHCLPSPSQITSQLLPTIYIQFKSRYGYLLQKKKKNRENNCITNTQTLSFSHSMRIRIILKDIYIERERELGLVSVAYDKNIIIHIGLGCFV